MRMFFDSEKAKEIEQKIIKKFDESSEKRTRIHLSDTCYCPLKVFHRLIEFPETKDSSGAPIMMTGIMGQMIIQSLYPEDWSEYESDKLPSHVDVMEFIDGEKHPLEIKFSNTVISKSSDIQVGWVKQLMRYLAVHDSDYGWFLIMNVRTRRFSAWKMIVEKEEREELLEWLDLFTDTIHTAVKMYEDDKLGTGYVDAVNYIFEKLPMEMTNAQVKDCSYCKYKKSRKRARQEIVINCEYVITKKDLIS